MLDREVEEGQQHLLIFDERGDGVRILRLVAFTKRLARLLRLLSSLGIHDVRNPERCRYRCKLAAIDESIGSTHRHEVQRTRDNESETRRQEDGSPTGLAHELVVAHDFPRLS